MLLGVSIVAHADTSAELENYELKALGRIEYDYDNSGIAGDHPSDFVYDADDFYAIEDLVKDGKTDLSTVINSYPNANVQTLDTFANLTAAVDSLTAFPSGTYYYDSTTGTDDASELIRYVKENDVYYLCNQNGNKTSDEAQTVDENNLVEYTEMSAENLTAGTAGMVDKAFVLGNGSDNISYRNLGYAEGYADGINNTGEIVYTYHSHTDDCYTTKYSYKCNKCGNAWGYVLSSPTAPTQCTNSECRKSNCLVISGSKQFNVCGKTTSSIESATIVFE